MDAGQWAAWAGAAVSLAAAVAAWWEARKARRSADAAEERANLARESAAQALGRAAEAQEALARSTTRVGTPWRMVRVGEHQYEVTNVSMEDARDVVLEFEDGLEAFHGAQDRDVVHAHATFTFGALRTGAGGSGSSVRITWHRPDGTTAQWETEVPR